MTHLTEEERDFLDDKFEQFKLDFWKKFKLPALGLAVVFAGLISVFATYLYMQARVNVMNSQAELAKAKVTFYEGMMKANKEINKMTEEFNNLVEQAGISVGEMKKYEDEMKSLTKKHNKLKRSSHSRSSKPKPVIATETVPKKSKQTKEHKDTFKINQTIQQQIKR